MPKKINEQKLALGLAFTAFILALITFIRSVGMGWDLGKLTKYAYERNDWNKESINVLTENLKNLNDAHNKLTEYLDNKGY